MASNSAINALSTIQLLWKTVLIVKNPQIKNSRSIKWISDSLNPFFALVVQTQRIPKREYPHCIWSRAWTWQIWNFQCYSSCSPKGRSLGEKNWTGKSWRPFGNPSH